VKKAVKHGLTRRLMLRVGMGDSSDSDSEDDLNGPGEKLKKPHGENETAEGDGGERESNKNEADGMNGDLQGGDEKRGVRWSIHERGRSKRRGQRRNDLEAGVVDPDASGKEVRAHRPSFQLSGLEQLMPADAVLAKEGADEVPVFIFCCPGPTHMCNLSVLARL
jgi:metal transporter CNNM